VISKSRIKELKSLQQKKCREDEKRYIAEGLKIVNEAILYHSKSIEQILFTNAAETKLNLNSTIANEKVDQGTIDKISSLKTPQPCLAVLRMPDGAAFKVEQTDDLILALDSIRDPGNLGTIIRLADWFGVSKIVCSPDTVDCYNPKVVQASMGAVLRVKIFYLNLIELAENNKHIEFSIYGTTLDGENIYKTEVKFPAIILMGNESEGLNNSIKPYLTKEIFIPNYSVKSEKTESLNVSTATSIILSEFRRIQHYSK
jgi:RNA methyltransferase, TrmH family